MTVANLIRELKELAETFGHHVEVVMPSDGFDLVVEEVRYEQGEIQLR